MEASGFTWHIGTPVAAAGGLSARYGRPTARYSSEHGSQNEGNHVGGNTGDERPNHNAMSSRRKLPVPVSNDGQGQRPQAQEIRWQYRKLHAALLDAASCGFGNAHNPI